MEGDQTESTGVTFIFFSADQAGATFECARDGGAFWSAPRRSPTPAWRRPTEFEVRAKGRRRQLDLTPAEYGWEIGDLTPPVDG